MWYIHARFIHVQPHTSVAANPKRKSAYSYKKFKFEDILAIFNDEVVASMNESIEIHNKLEFEAAKAIVVHITPLVELYADESKFD